MTTELRSIYSGPIRRALEGLQRKVITIEEEVPPPVPGPVEERWGVVLPTPDASGNALVTFPTPFPTGHIPAVMATQGFANVLVTVWGATEAYVQLHYQRTDGSVVSDITVGTTYRAWWPTNSPT